MLAVVRVLVILGNNLLVVKSQLILGHKDSPILESRAIQKDLVQEKKAHMVQMQKLHAIQNHAV